MPMGWMVVPGPPISHTSLATVLLSNTATDGVSAWVPLARVTVTGRPIASRCAHSKAWSILK
eukprot:6169917-Prymnesium_polylepis.2